MQAQTRTLWLKVASEILVAFGLLTFLASAASTAAPTSFLADLIFWPLDGAQAVDTEASRLLSAIGGGVMVGWGVLLYLLTARVYVSDPKLARFLISASIGTWFVVDGLGSIMAGAPINAVLNVGFLALFMIPLWYPSDRSSVEPEARLGAKS